ncbi:MAG: ABC transporter permease, partial [Candidatus Aminicenantes bacterium]
MIRNYLKTALRNIKVQRLYSAINIAGLAVGIACCILIFLYVSFELSYDDYHLHSDRLYRIVMNAKAVNLTTSAIGYDWNTVRTPIPMGASITQNFSQVEKMARLDYDSNILVKHGEIRFYEQECLYADQTVFDIFSIKFLQGTPERALTDPDTVVLTQRMAEKYFERENPLGKFMNINDKDFEITGVVENCPLNTQLKYDLLMSFQSKYDDAYLKKTGWINYHLETYIRLREGTDPKETEEQFNKLWGKVQGFGGYDTTHKYFLEPVSDIHLEPTFGSRSRLHYLYIFVAIGILILSIACINFINLMTARSSSRAKEIGVRKVIGAVRSQLIRQFLSESLLMTLCAFMASIPLAAVLLPS